MKFTTYDKVQLQEKGIKEQLVLQQLNRFKTGYPFLKLNSAASVSNGILRLSAPEISEAIDKWKKYLLESHRILKFVPASGAASRMFKGLFSFINAEYNVPTTDFEKNFFEGLFEFAFYDELNKISQKRYAASPEQLIREKRYKDVVRLLLEEDGLDYGALPKGVLLFHRYENFIRTAVEEHLVEGALYAKQKDECVHIHFTVSSDHKQLFNAILQNVLKRYEKEYGVTFNITFSEQKTKTDTIAANIDNEPFRNADGSLLFRPGGHGALIENLNDLDADIVFIKNIDNVVPDYLKEDTVRYKKVIGGILVYLQEKIFHYLQLLSTQKYDKEKLNEILQFVTDELFCINPEISSLSEKELVDYLKKKLNRPIRVCGMVKNIGEPGGGPFLAYNEDGTISLQILESSQIDINNSDYKAMFENGTHFNPVDLVCGLYGYNGCKYDLLDFVDHNTGFISEKSKDGKSLKALELPGLWNGAMSDWNTIFVEVPLSTFNPVKTVNDLLRKEHQPRK